MFPLVYAGVSKSKCKKKEKKRAEKSFNFTWQMILLGINAK
jgi:hypothetical protein